MLWLDAVRMMRRRQIIGRCRRVIPRALLAAGLRVRVEPGWRPIAAGLGCSPAAQGGVSPPPHEIQSFTAYGCSRRFADRGFWDHPGDPLIFRFHLHGFSDLAAYAAGQRTRTGDAFWSAVIDSWLAAHDRPADPAWHPYPTSVRIISWSAGLSAMQHWPRDTGERVAAEILRQARYLRRAVEHDVGGNHVIKNATALAIAGGVHPSSGLLESALRLLERETASQVLSDGGHEERTTSYHREVRQDLADVRDLLGRIGRPTPRWLDEVLERMGHWASAMAGPDGRLPLLNDAWQGPPIRSGVARPDGSELTLLRESGYVVLRHATDQLTFDCGPLCPRHLPAHAHADALSVVLWMDSRPVLIDRGSGAYVGQVRGESRSTGAHNTVEVEGEDQCVFFGSFRAARLPQVAEPIVKHHGDVTVVTSAHTGYRRLFVPVHHARSVLWWPGRGVVLVDRVMAAMRVQVRSSLTLAPGLFDDPAYAGALTIRHLPGSGEIARRDVAWWPSFGHEERTAALELRIEASGATVFGWSLLRGSAHVIECDHDHIVLAAGRSATEVPLTWQSGPLRG